MKLIIEPLIKFLDDPESGDNRHASAINGVIGEDLCAAVFEHYLSNYASFSEINIIDERPTQGMKGGKRLDRWITARRPGGDQILYQCEIKNWAASAIGGQRLPVKCDGKELQKVSGLGWERQMHSEFQNEKQPSVVTKVLLPMRIPKNFPSKKVEPLLLYWMPISYKPSLDPEPFFTVPTNIFHLPMEIGLHSFSQLHVFSTSLYLRRLLNKGIRFLNLALPNAKRRIEVLNDIVK